MEEDCNLLFFNGAMSSTFFIGMIFENPYIVKHVYVACVERLIIFPLYFPIVLNPPFRLQIFHNETYQ